MKKIVLTFIVALLLVLPVQVLAQGNSQNANRGQASRVEEDTSTQDDTEEIKPKTTRQERMAERKARIAATTADRQQKLVAKCEAVVARIAAHSEKTEKTYQTIVDARTNILEKLNVIAAAAETAEIDTENLKTIVADFTEQSEVALGQYVDYSTALVDAGEVDCANATSVTDLHYIIEDARSLRKELGSSLKTLVSTFKESLVSELKNIRELISQSTSEDTDQAVDDEQPAEDTPTNSEQSE